LVIFICNLLIFYVKMNKKKYLIALVALAVFITVFIILTKYKHVFFPNAYNSVSKYETGMVDTGRVISGIAAFGVVEPESEVLLLSPGNSIIKKISKVVGTHVNTGDVILRLDPTEVEDQIEKIEDQLEVKRNNLEKNRLAARGIRVDLDYNVEMKKLQIASLKAELEDQEQLLEVGGISPAAFEKTKQQKVIADKEMQMTLEKNSIRLKQLQAEENGMLLEIKMQERELENAKELLDKMILKAPSSGIILSVFGKEGEKVSQSQTLVRMSNLSRYKITAVIDQKDADILKTGGMAFAQVDQVNVPGQIGNIKPIVENNKIEFNVHMDYSSQEYFKPNQNVELLIVIDSKDSVLRVKNGPGINSEKLQQLFRIESSKALRTDVEIGLFGKDYVEIKSGLKPGDQVIISDMTAFRHKEAVELNEE